MTDKKHKLVALYSYRRRKPDPTLEADAYAMLRWMAENERPQLSEVVDFLQCEIDAELNRD